MLLFVGYASSSVVETIGTFSLRIASICGRTFFIDEFVHSTTTSGLVDLMALRASSGHLDAQRSSDGGDLTEVAADLCRIDIDSADDLEALALRNLLHDPDTDWAEPEMKNLDGSRRRHEHAP